MRKKKKAPRKAPAVFPLRELLGRYGVSQRQLAKRTGMDEQRVSDLANNRHAPSWGTILRICTAIGADLGDLAPAPAKVTNGAT